MTNFWNIFLKFFPSKKRTTISGTDRLVLTPEKQLNKGNTTVSYNTVADIATYVSTQIPTGVQSVVAGANITVDNTDPQNPVVSSTGGSSLWAEGDPFGGSNDYLYNVNQDLAQGFIVYKTDGTVTSLIAILNDTDRITLNTQDGVTETIFSLQPTGVTITTDAAVPNIILTLPEYVDDAAADADGNLNQGALYKLTGDRTLYQKP